MHPRLQADTKPIPSMSAERFFHEICPQVLDARRDALHALGGRFAFSVKGEGAWILDFEKAAVRRLAPDAKETVDLALQFAAHTFVRLMKGTLDVTQAINAGEIAVAGDLRFFSRLSAAFRPSA